MKKVFFIARSNPLRTSAISICSINYINILKSRGKSRRKFSALNHYAIEDKSSIRIRT